MEFLLTILINTAWVIVGVLAILLGWRGCQLAFGNTSHSNETNNPTTCSGCNCQPSADKA